MIWVFAAGAVAMSGWCFVVLTACMFLPAPTSSIFPEIDFASRIVGLMDSDKSDMASVCRLLFPLSSAQSSQIIKVLNKRRYFVQSAQGGLQNLPGHVSIFLEREESQSE